MAGTKRLFRNEERRPSLPLSAEESNVGGRVGTAVTAAFGARGVVAGLAGMLLSGYSGGAFLEMGSPYLLRTGGAVVLGGNLISGGSATAACTLFGAVLLVLILSS
jgi:ribose transport system permease protein